MTPRDPERNTNKLKAQPPTDELPWKDYAELRAHWAIYRCVSAQTNRAGREATDRSAAPKCVWAGRALPAHLKQTHIHTICNPTRRRVGWRSEKQYTTPDPGTPNVTPAARAQYVAPHLGWGETGRPQEGLPAGPGLAATRLPPAAPAPLPRRSPLPPRSGGAASGPSPPQGPARAQPQRCRPPRPAVPREIPPRPSGAPFPGPEQIELEGPAAQRPPGPAPHRSPPPPSPSCPPAARRRAPAHTYLRGSERPAAPASLGAARGGGRERAAASPHPAGRLQGAALRRRAGAGGRQERAPERGRAASLRGAGRGGAGGRRRPRGRPAAAPPFSPWEEQVLGPAQSGAGSSSLCPVTTSISQHQLQGILSPQRTVPSASHHPTSCHRGQDQWDDTVTPTAGHDQLMIISALNYSNSNSAIYSAAPASLLPAPTASSP